MRRMIWFARKRRIEINSMRYLRGCERFPMSHRKIRSRLQKLESKSRRGCGPRYAGGADARVEWRICFAVGGAAGNFRRDCGTYGAALGSGRILGGRRRNLSVADHPRRIPQFRHPCEVGTDPSAGGQLGGKLRSAQRRETGRRVGRAGEPNRASGCGGKERSRKVRKTAARSGRRAKRYRSHLCGPGWPAFVGSIRRTTDSSERFIRSCTFLESSYFSI